MPPHLGQVRAGLTDSNPDSPIDCWVLICLKLYGSFHLFAVVFFLLFIFILVVVVYTLVVVSLTADSLWSGEGEASSSPP